jgi:hypothetical protein
MSRTGRVPSHGEAIPSAPADACHASAEGAARFASQSVARDDADSAERLPVTCPTEDGELRRRWIERERQRLIDGAIREYLDQDGRVMARGYFLSDAFG